METFLNLLIVYCCGLWLVAGGFFVVEKKNWQYVHIDSVTVRKKILSRHQNTNLPRVPIALAGRKVVCQIIVGLRTISNSYTYRTV